MALRYNLMATIASRRLASAERRRHRERLETHAHSFAGLQPGDDVMIREIACGDGSCPGLETVVCVSPKGRASQIFKLPMSLEAVGLADVEVVLERAGLVSRPRHIDEILPSGLEVTGR